MAIVNHGADIVGDETWAAADEHHITNFCAINGGAPGAPIVVTIEVGVVVYFDGNFSIFNGADIGDYGQVNAIGTEVGKIVFREDPTNFPHPQWGVFKGILSGPNSVVDLDWVQVQHGSYFLGFFKVQGAADNANTVNNCAALHCDDGFWKHGNLGSATDVGYDDYIQVDGLYTEDIKGSFWEWNIAVDCNGVNLLKNIGLFVVKYGFILSTNAKHKITVENMLVESMGMAFLSANAAVAGESRAYSFDGLFMTGGGSDNGGYCGGLAIWNMAFRETVLVENSSVFAAGRWGVYAPNNLATDIVTIQYSDFIDSHCAGVYYTSGLNVLTLDHLYFEGNHGYTGTDRPAGDPPQGQWYDVTNAVSPTNIEDTPNFELDVENIVEGVPAANSITITYDAKAGNTSKRLMGIPFIKYGVASGDLPNIAGLVPWNVKDRVKAFAKWTSEYGVFKTLGHSVTISNLKPGTTYYYKCCFIDPLGRIAEGTEGDFSTTGAAGGAAEKTDVGEGGIG